MSTQSMHKYIQIDEEGYFHFGENRVTDIKDGLSLFKSLKFLETGQLVTHCEGHEVIVEAFDQPFVALDIEKNDLDNWKISLPYGFSASLNVNSFCLDEWDRFLGESTEGIPFVLSRSAQARFFLSLIHI